MTTVAYSPLMFARDMAWTSADVRQRPSKSFLPKVAVASEMTYVSKEMIDYLIKGVSGEFGRSRFTKEFNTTAAAAGAAPIKQ